MATLYVRNLPERLHDRLRRQAEASRRSVSAEALELLARGLDAPREGRSLAHVLEAADAVRSRHRAAAGSPSAAELIREDRDR